MFDELSGIIPTEYTYVYCSVAGSYYDYISTSLLSVNVMQTMLYICPYISFRLTYLKCN